MTSLFNHVCSPFLAGLNAMEAAGKVNNRCRMTIPEGCHCPSALKSLMERCWAQNPANRPDFEEICGYLEKMDDEGNIKNSSSFSNYAM